MMLLVHTAHSRYEASTVFPGYLKRQTDIVSLLKLVSFRNVKEVSFMNTLFKTLSESTVPTDTDNLPLLVIVLKANCQVFIPSVFL